MSVRRQNAVVNEQLDLRVAFRYDDTGTLFDPFAVSAVEIWDETMSNLLETITTITKFSTGVYGVITSASWNTGARNVIDNWIFKKTAGGTDYKIQNTTTIYAPVVIPPTPVIPGIPLPADVLKYLEGYCVDDLISNSFIQNCITNEVLPFVETHTRSSFTGLKTAVEFYSGTGKDQLIMNRRGIVEITAIRLVSGNDIDTTINIASLQLIADEGILKVKSGLSEYYNYRIFPKGNNNIKVTYTYGFATPPADVFIAICKLTAILVLDNLEGRTGGGQLSTQSYNRQYGNMGKFSNIRKRFNQQAMAILRRYSTVVVGA